MSANVPLPFDVRATNAAASALFTVLALLCLAALAWWGLRQPAFSLRAIRIQGEVSHNSAATLRAIVAPRLTGNLLTIDLAAASAVFESVPWVRKAVVRRVFPDRLDVVLEEHKAAAFWGAENESRLVNTFGEVFEANAGEVESESLPRLEGAAERASELLAMHRRLEALFSEFDLAIEELALSPRGGWRASLDTGAAVELGAGTPDEVAARAARFLRTLTQVASRYGRRAEALESADLRHADGYAVRLRGVTTGAEAAGKK